MRELVKNKYYAGIFRNSRYINRGFYEDEKLDFFAFCCEKMKHFVRQLTFWR